MKGKVPKKATKEKILSIVYLAACAVSWLLLVVTIVHIIFYYYHYLRNDPYNSEAMKIGVYLIVGTFLFLFVYPDKARRIFGIKDVKRR